MIQIHSLCYGVYHRLIANKDLTDNSKNNWKSGDYKDVMISKFQDGRYAVMGLWFPNMMEPAKSFMDYYYQIFPNEDAIHEAFTEQFTNLRGYSTAKE